VDGKFAVIGMVAAWLALGAEATVATGDGGAVRYSERRGDRLITVFTAPTPLRPGIADVSVLLQDANLGKPLLDVPVIVYAHPIRHPQGRFRTPATTDAATNKLMRAAQLHLSEPGPWRLELVVEDSRQWPPIGFDVDVAEALPPWMQMGPWIGWPLAAIGFFAIHQLLVRRRLRHINTRLNGSSQASVARGRSKRGLSRDVTLRRF
jgi:hypothetical protein